MFSRQSAFNHLWAGAAARGTLPLPLGPRRLSCWGIWRPGAWRLGAGPDPGARRGTPSLLHRELAVQDVAEERVGPGNTAPGLSPSSATSSSVALGKSPSLSVLWCLGEPTGNNRNPCPTG